MVVRLGIEVLLEEKRSVLRGARVGAVVHPASILSNFQHTADALFVEKSFHLGALFGVVRAVIVQVDGRFELVDVHVLMHKNVDHGVDAAIRHLWRQDCPLCLLTDASVHIVAVVLFVVIGTADPVIRVATGAKISLAESVAQRLISLEHHDYATLPRLARSFTALTLLASILWAALLAPGLRTEVRWIGATLIVVGIFLLETALLATLHRWIPLLAAGLTVPLATLAATLVPEQIGRAHV